MGFGGRQKRIAELRNSPVCRIVADGAVGCFGHCWAGGLAANGNLKVHPSLHRLHP